MRKIAFCTVLLVATLLPRSVTAGSPSHEESVQFRVGPTQDTFLLYEPVWLHFQVVNTSRDSLWHQGFSPGAALKIRLRDGNGRLIETLTSIACGPGRATLGTGDVIEDYHCLTSGLDSPYRDTLFDLPYLPIGVYSVWVAFQFLPAKTGAANEAVMVVDSVGFVVASPPGKSAVALMHYLGTRALPPERDQSRERLLGLAYLYPDTPYGRLALRDLCDLAKGHRLGHVKLAFDPTDRYLQSYPNDPSGLYLLHSRSSKMKRRQRESYLKALLESANGTLIAHEAARILGTRRRSFMPQGVTLSATIGRLRHTGLVDGHAGGQTDTRLAFSLAVPYGAVSAIDFGGGVTGSGAFVDRITSAAASLGLRTYPVRRFSHQADQFYAFWNMLAIAAFPVNFAPRGGIGWEIGLGIDIAVRRHRVLYSEVAVGIWTLTKLRGTGNYAGVQAPVRSAALIDKGDNYVKPVRFAIGMRILP